MRPKYKALYEAEQRKAEDKALRLKMAQRELNRVRGVLSRHAAAVVVPRMMELPRPGNDPVTLSELDYEAYGSWVLANRRFTNDDLYEFVGLPALAFRARRVTMQRGDDRTEGKTQFPAPIR